MKIFRNDEMLSATYSAGTGIGVGTLIPLSVTIIWAADYNNKERIMTRTYNVRIEVFDVTDIDYMSNANSTRSGASGSCWLNREYLNMFKLK